MYHDQFKTAVLPLLKNVSKAAELHTLFYDARQISVVESATTARVKRTIDSSIEKYSNTHQGKDSIKDWIAQYGYSSPAVYLFSQNYREIFSKQEEILNPDVDFQRLAECYRESRSQHFSEFYRTHSGSNTSIDNPNSLFELISKEGDGWYEKAVKLQAEESSKADAYYDLIIRGSLLIIVLFFPGIYSLDTFNFWLLGFAVPFLNLLYAINERYFVFI